MPLTARNRFGGMSVNGLAANATLVNGHGRLTAVDGRGRYRLENRFGRG